ncbi:unnamed protein product [Mycena citricolor]|uniref:G domain-containing protein n=1 Tax=Mycena citricolor TaxID=2018698 RepID=A0AAD2H338_9AGAR|nr:unnamed protein product [Mycena citricolor]
MTTELQFINLLSGSDFEVGSGLQSCTAGIQVTPPFPANGGLISLIDTPGFYDPDCNDVEVLLMISSFLAQAYAEGRRLSGILYTHRISDIRMDSTTERNFQLLQHLCGEDAFPNISVVTTMWDEVGLELAESRETELAEDACFFKQVLDGGATMQRHQSINDLESARAIVDELAVNIPYALKVQIELVDEQKKLVETSVGQELERELTEQLAKHRVELSGLRKEMKQAFRQQDDETRLELEMESHRLQEEMGRLQADIERLRSTESEFATSETETDGMNQRAPATTEKEPEQPVEESAEEHPIETRVADAPNVQDAGLSAPAGEDKVMKDAVQENKSVEETAESRGILGMISARLFGL